MKTLIALPLILAAVIASAPAHADHRYHNGISPGAAAVIGGIIGYSAGRAAAPYPGYGGAYGGYPAPVYPPVVPVAPGGAYPDVRVWYRTEFVFNPACNCMVPVLVPSY